MDNAAQRLLALLERAKAYPHPQQSAQSVWKEVFSVEDAYDIPAKLGALLVLSGQAARQVLEADPSTSQAVRYWRGKIFQLCAHGHGAAWKEVVSNIDNHTIEYLRLQARLLNYACPAADLPIDRFVDARKALETAIDEIRQSDLDPSLKLRIIERIREIVVAIDNYAITGQQGVFDAFKLSIVDFGEELSRDDVPGKSALREGLTIIAELMAIAGGAATLAPPVARLISWLPT